MHQTTTHITLDGRPCVVPDPVRFPAVAGRANAFWCPIGPAVGRGWVLMLRRDLEPLLAASTNRHTLSMQAGDKPSGRIELPQLLLVDAKRLSTGTTAAAEALYLVELADRRWLLERLSDTGSLAFNLRSFAQAADYLTGASGATWASAIEQLWNTMSTQLGTYPGLPAGYAPHGVPEDWQFIGTSAWAALGELLEKIACTVVYDPLAATFSIARLEAAQTNLPADLNIRPRLYDAETLAAPAAGLPETIRVYFHSHLKNFGQEHDVELAGNWKLADHSTSLDVPTNLVAAEPGTVLALWDDLPRVLDENNASANSAALAARAAARAAAWLDEHQLNAGSHQVFPGIAADLLPGAQLKAVLWRAWGPAAGGTATEIFTPPGPPSA